MFRDISFFCMFGSTWRGYLDKQTLIVLMVVIYICDDDDMNEICKEQQSVTGFL